MSYWKVDKKRLKNRIFFSTKNIIQEQMDIIAILTEWEEFKTLQFKDSKVFDGRNILRGKNVINLGI